MAVLNTARIKLLREATGMTQAEAARKAGLPSAQKWSDLENGERDNVTLKTITRLAKALGCKGSELIKE